MSTNNELTDWLGHYNADALIKAYGEDSVASVIGEAKMKCRGESKSQRYNYVRTILEGRSDRSRSEKKPSKEDLTSIRRLELSRKGFRVIENLPESDILALKELLKRLSRKEASLMLGYSRNTFWFTERYSRAVDAYNDQFGDAPIENGVSEEEIKFWDKVDRKALIESMMLTMHDIVVKSGKSIYQYLRDVTENQEKKERLQKTQSPEISGTCDNKQDDYENCFD